MKKSGKNLIGLVVAVIILVASGIIGNVTGVFDGFEDALGTIKFNPQVILEAVIAICFLVALRCIVDIIFSFLKKQKGRAKTLSTIINSLIKYAILLVGFCWVLTIIGVNVSTIFASVGVIALIVGFGAESLVADVVTGVFILFENQYNVGDIIEVDGFRGTVENISIRTVSLMDPAGNIKIINNSNLKNVINRSNHGSVAVTEVGVSYSTDLEALEAKMDKITTEIKVKHPDIFVGDVSYLGVENLADSSVVLKFKADVKEADIFRGRRVLNKEIKCIFDRENVEIAFPQLDVHTK